jgi:hypothetical protein
MRLARRVSRERVRRRFASLVAFHDHGNRLTGQSTSRSITPASSGFSRLPLVRGGRPLKRWRYVGVFNDELLACAASIRVGVARQAFWAVYLREERQMHERTRMLRARRAVGLSPGALRIRDAGVELVLELEEELGWEARWDDPRGGEVRTRKQAGIAARGALRIGGGGPRVLDALAVVDDTAGYHARHTEWRWSAGVGEGPGGAALAWNLVRGVNDPPSGSERAVWIDGVPHEVPPVEFSADLARIDCDDGSELHFNAEAERARRENLGVVKSDYRAPFGAFHGTLPGGAALAHGLGVVEYHRATW